MDKELNFVTKYYRHGGLDIRRAFRTTLSKAGRRQKIDIRWIAIAAVAAVLIVGGAITVLHRSPAQHEMVIMAGARNRNVTLADGTRVTLAPHSSLTYDDDCREVELTGKAYFDIHHDNSHPFVLHDEDYVIRDIGTKLVVDEKQLGGDRKTTRVYVIEGSVSLMATRGTKGVIVDKAEMYQIGTDATKPNKVNSRSANDMTVWATHEFHFDDTPLPVVLSDLSDYYHVNLSCPDSGNKRLTADFRATSLDSIKSMIEETLNVRIR